MTRVFISLGLLSVPLAASPVFGQMNATYGLRTNLRRCKICGRVHDQERARAQQIANDEVVLQIGHAGAVITAAFSPDGNQLLTGSEDGTAVLWEVASGRRLRTFVADGQVQAVAFHPEGRRLFIASSDGAVSLWDAAENRKLREFWGSRCQFRNLVLGPEGGSFLTTYWAETQDAHVAGAIVWEVATGRRLIKLGDRARPVDTALFHPSGKNLLALFGGETVVFDLTAGRAVKQLEGFATCLGMSHDGRYLLIGKPEGVSLWDMTALKRLRSFQVPVKEGRSPHDTRFWAVTRVAMTSDNRLVVAALHNGCWVAWQRATGKLVHSQLLGKSVLVSAEIGSDNQRLLLLSKLGMYGEWGGMPSLMSLTTGLETRIQAVATEGFDAKVAALSPVGGHGVLGTQAGDVHLFDSSTGGTKHTLFAETGLIEDIEPSAKSCLLRLKGKSLFCQGVKQFERPSPVYLWDTGREQPVKALDPNSQRDSSVDPVNNEMQIASPDGRHAIKLERWTGKAVLWDLEANKQLHHLATDMTCAAYLSKGSQVVTGHEDGSLTLWDIRTAKRIRRLLQGGGPVGFIVCSPKRDCFASASDLNRLILWSADDGRKLAEFHADAKPIRPLTVGAEDSRSHRSSMRARFSKDGRLLFVWDLRGLAIVWDVSARSELAQIASLNGGRDWLALTPQGLFDGTSDARAKVSYRKDGSLRLLSLRHAGQDGYCQGLLPALIQGERPRPLQTHP